MEQEFPSTELEQLHFVQFKDLVPCWAQGNLYIVDSLPSNKGLI